MITNLERVRELEKIVTNDCVIYNKSVGAWGYGHVKIKGKTIKASRIVMQDHIGRELDSKEWVLHSCDNRLCINIQHLRIGTPRDNSQDAIKRNRQTRNYGSTNGSSKITSLQAKQIKQRKLNGERAVDLAKEFGISYAQIYNITNGIHWNADS